MTAAIAMQVRVALRETAGGQVLHHVLAADEEAAAPFIARWNALGSTRAGRTEVVWQPLAHPVAQPTPCGGTRVLDESDVIGGVTVDTTRGCPGCPDCTAGAR